MNQSIQWNTPEMVHKFKIGQRFIPVGRKDSSVWTVTDLLTTRNSEGKIMSIRYVATHEFLGKMVSDYDVLETTIARGLI